MRIVLWLVAVIAVAFQARGEGIGKAAQWENKLGPPKVTEGSPVPIPDDMSFYVSSLGSGWKVDGQSGDYSSRDAAANAWWDYHNRNVQRASYVSVGNTVVYAPVQTLSSDSVKLSSGKTPDAEVLSLRLNTSTNAVSTNSFPNLAPPRRSVRLEVVETMTLVWRQDGGPAMTNSMVYRSVQRDQWYELREEWVPVAGKQIGWGFF